MDAIERVDSAVGYENSLNGGTFSGREPTRTGERMKEEVGRRVGILSLATFIASRL